MPEAATSADLERLCGAKSGLCAVALLDASDQAFQGHLDTWKQAAGKWAKQPLHFLWVDASRQVSLVISATLYTSRAIGAIGVMPPFAWPDWRTLGSSPLILRGVPNLSSTLFGSERRLGRR